MKNKHSNETVRLLMERASCRSFVPRRISAAVMRRILDCGAHAATGGNLQPYSVIVIQNPGTNRKLAAMCHQPFIGQAPANLLFCIDLHRLERWAKLSDAPFTARDSFRHFWISFQDTIIAAQGMCTAADALGLGSCYIGTIMESLPTVRSLFALPAGVLPVVLLTIGYPKGTQPVNNKLGPAVIAHRERYRELSDAGLLAAFAGKHPGFKLEATPQRLRGFERACTRVAGAAFAKRCRERVKKQGHFNMAQLYFGLHYRADRMPDANARFMRQIEQHGFGWFGRFTAKQWGAAAAAGKRHGASPRS